MKIKKKHLFIALAVLVVIVSILHYGHMYLQNYNLVFTQEDKTILSVFAGCVIFICCMMGFFIYKVNNLESTINSFKDELLEELMLFEDNNIQVNRDTQNLIIRLSKKLGVASDDT